MPPRHDKNQGLFQHADKSWGIDCYIFGKRVRRKVGTLMEARKEYQRLKAEEQSGRVKISPRTVRRKNLGDWIDIYLIGRPGKTNHYFAERWREMVGEMLPENLTVTALRIWVARQVENGKAASSIHREIDVLSAIYTEAIRSKEIHAHESPFADIKALNLPKINNLREVCFEPAQLLRLREAMGEFWWPYMEFSLLTGIRFGSMAKLQWDDIDWIHEVAMLWTPKRGFRQPVPLSTRALELLFEQKQKQAVEYPDCPWCWPSRRGKQLHKDNFRNKVWRPAFNRVGLDEATWHDTRHTTASLMVRGDEGLYTVQQALGQSDNRTTERYAYLGMSKVREAFGRVGEMLAQKLGIVQNRASAGTAELPKTVHSGVHNPENSGPKPGKPE